MSRTQETIDRLWRATAIKILPSWVSPNFFTIIRLVLIPAVLFFLAIGGFWLAFVFFVLAALLDSLDGALARARRLVTSWGLLLDPLADKLLVILTSLFLLFYYPFFGLLLLVLFFDLIGFLAGLVFYIIQPGREMPPANFWGKAKMTFEAIGLAGIFLFLVSSPPYAAWLLYLSGGFLILSVIFNFGALIRNSRNFRK